MTRRELDGRADLDRELAFHRDATIAELVAAGCSPEAARAEAERRFGDAHRWRARILAASNQHPDFRTRAALALRRARHGTTRDFRHAFRQFRQAPLFSAAAVVVFALGIAANALVFSLIDGVLLSPLPFPNPDRLVLVWGRDPSIQAGFTDLLASAADLEDWRRETRSMAAIGAVTPESQNLTTGGMPERVSGVSVMGDFFDALGVPAALGRTIRASDSGEGQPRVAVLGDRLWRARFAADPGILGRTIELDGRPFEVVGVMPPRFAFPNASEFSPVYGFEPDPQVYIAWGQSPFDSSSRGNKVNLPVARIRPGVSLVEAQADMDRIASALADRYPGFNGTLTLALTPLKRQVVSRVARPLSLLAVAVSMVLGIACLNAAHLLIVRASGRGRELAMRVALGAGRADLWRLAVAEALVLAAAGGTAGLLLTHWGLRTFHAIAPERFPRLDTVVLDGRVLLFTTVLMAASGVLVGAASVIRVSAGDLQTRLRARGVFGGRGAHARLIIVTEVALSLALLVAKGLVVKSFWQVARVPPGIAVDDVSVVRLSLPVGQYTSGRSWRGTFDRIVDELRRIDAVERASYTFQLPMGGTAASQSYIAEDGVPRFMLIHRVEPQYFEAMGIPLQRGQRLDAASDLPAVVINETLARAHFPGADPIGRVIAPDGVRSRIVGVVGDVRHSGPEEPPLPELYRHSAIWMMWVVIKTKPGATVDRASIERAVHAVDPRLPVSAIQPLAARVAVATAERRFTTLVMSTFAVVASALALVGLYAVTALLVSARRREIGLRIALGATRGGVMRLIYRQTFPLVAAGLAAGVFIAALGARFLTPLLFQTDARDPLVFAGVVGGLAAASALAIYLPARRAASTDPVAVIAAE